MSKKPGPKKKRECDRINRYSVGLSPSQFELISAAARMRGMSFSELIRKLIKDFLKDQSSKKAM